MNGICVQPVRMVDAPFMPMATQLPLPDTVEVRLIVPELVVIFTVKVVPDRVAATVPGSCFGPISYFSMSFLTSLRRHSHCALVATRLPSCIANGFGSLVFFFRSPAAAVQPAPVFSAVPPGGVMVVPAPALPVVVLRRRLRRQRRSLRRVRRPRHRSAPRPVQERLGRRSRPQGRHLLPHPGYCHPRASQQRRRHPCRAARPSSRTRQGTGWPVKRQLVAGFWCSSGQTSDK